MRKAPRQKSLRPGKQGRFLSIVIGQLIEQNCVQQRLVHLDAAVVADEAELAKAIHEEADAGPRGAEESSAHSASAKSAPVSYSPDLW